MKSKRATGAVTMAAVAAAAGVHQTTVSLALRDHPRLPVATRERIRAVADHLGYRPDPLLGAFNFHRQARRGDKSRSAIAFILDARARRAFAQKAGHPLVVEGARQAAAERGYELDLFTHDPQTLSGRRLGRILQARSIEAVVLSTFETGTDRLDLPWDHLSAVKIESRHLWPALPVVTNDQYQVARLGLQKLRALGYRRIGLLVTTEAERRLGDAFRMGLTIEQAEWAARDRVPPLLLSDEQRPHASTVVAAWLRQHRIEAIAANLNDVPAYLKREGLGVPRDVAFASLDAPADQPAWAGVVQNHAMVGRRAVEEVLSLLYTHRRGVPAVPTVTYVPGAWRDGETAPGR